MEWVIYSIFFSTQCVEEGGKKQRSVISPREKSVSQSVGGCVGSSSGFPITNVISSSESHFLPWKTHRRLSPETRPCPQSSLFSSFVRSVLSILNRAFPSNSGLFQQNATFVQTKLGNCFLHPGFCFQSQLISSHLNFFCFFHRLSYPVCVCTYGCPFFESSNFIPVPLVVVPVTLCVIRNRVTNRQL